MANAARGGGPGRFHDELLKYLRGEPNDIRPGTIGMIRAEIARMLGTH